MNSTTENLGGYPTETEGGIGVQAMPRYQCHKTVHALQIRGISVSGELGFDPPFMPRLMSKEWLDKHNPAVGGYLVLYEDGYESYSPQEPFESGYSQLGDALTVPGLTNEEIERRITYHPPSAAARRRHDAVRAQIRMTMQRMNVELPSCREMSIVMTKLEEAMYWANAAIARNHDKLLAGETAGSA